MYLHIIALILAGAITFSFADMPIPLHELGYVYKRGHHCATVKIAAFIDLNCPDSKAAFHNFLPAVDSFKGTEVKVRVYIFPLAHHRNSFLLAKATHFLHGFLHDRENSNATVFDWIELVFDHLENLTNQATCNMSEHDVINYISTIAQTNFPVTDAEFKEGINKEEIDFEAELEWKYACTRGVYTTPMFSVNDVFVRVDVNQPTAKYVELIRNILPKNATFHKHSGCDEE